MGRYARRRQVYTMEDKGWHGHRLGINPFPPGAITALLFI